MNKLTALSLLCMALVAGMAPWFATAAALPDMVRESGMAAGRQALLTSAVQGGFVVGALGVAISGVADRLDPRHVMIASALMNAVTTAGLLIAPVGGDMAVALRFLTGVGFAGIYPVSMKIAVGWGLKDRGLIVGALVAALTLGSSLPHFVAFAGGAEWRVVIGAMALSSALAAGFGPFLSLGPHHAKAPAFEPGAIKLMWTNRRIRAATGGYLGHMWELYAMWSWIAAASAAGFAISGAEDPVMLASLAAGLAIALGAVGCAPAGWIADRKGKANVAAGAMTLSGVCALAVAAAHGGPLWLSFLLIILWGFAVIPDSAQFSAMIADAAPPHLAGSLMAMQTALGFALTILTVQATPWAVDSFGWPLTLTIMAIGPAFGVAALRPFVGRL